MDIEKLKVFVNDLIEGYYSNEEELIYENSGNVSRDLKELEKQKEEAKKEFKEILEG